MRSCVYACICVITCACWRHVSMCQGTLTPADEEIKSESAPAVTSCPPTPGVFLTGLSYWLMVTSQCPQSDCKHAFSVCLYVSGEVTHINPCSRAVFLCWSFLVFLCSCVCWLGIHNLYNDKGFYREGSNIKTASLSITKVIIIINDN